MILLKILNEKMKKVLFLMLFLIVLGAASVKAQVRIGGNAAPNASALLDLNATDAANNGTKGLALPRVNLTSNTMLLSGVTANLTGMLVYNTTATLGAIGIYYWNGATWVKASLPSTSAADSGKVLKFNGTTWTLAWPGLPSGHNDTLALLTTRPNVTMTLIVDSSTSMYKYPGVAINSVYVAGLNQNDLCFVSGSGYPMPINVITNFFRFTWFDQSATGLLMVRIRCYRLTP